MPLNLEIKRKKSAISLTPLIDVVFILLLFFMLTSTFTKWRQVDTPLPMASAETTVTLDSDTQTLILKANDGFVWLNDDKISLDDIDYFARLIADNPQSLYVVQSESGVTLQSLMTLADRLKSSGAEKVSIANAFKEQP